MAEYKDADFNPGTGSSSITTGTTPSDETPATSDSNVTTGTTGSSETPATSDSNVTPTTSDSTLVPSRGAYHAQGQFRFWCQKVLPLVYDDSLSYYELLCKVVDYLNKTMQNVAVLESDVTETNNQFANLQTFVNETVDKQAESFNQLQENLNANIKAQDAAFQQLQENLNADIEKQNTAFDELQTNLNNNIKAQNDAFEQFQTNINGNIEKQDKAFEDLQTYTNDQIATIRQTYLELQQYVNDYFNNLDVQEEINNKLDTMASDGSLSTLIEPFFKTYSDQVTALTERLNNLVMNTGDSTSEIVDARLNTATGVTAANLGERLQIDYDSIGVIGGYKNTIIQLEEDQLTFPQSFIIYHGRTTAFPATTITLNMTDDASIIYATLSNGAVSGVVSAPWNVPNDESTATYALPSNAVVIGIYHKPNLYIATTIPEYNIFLHVSGANYKAKYIATMLKHASAYLNFESSSSTHPNGITFNDREFICSDGISRRIYPLTVTTPYTLELTDDDFYSDACYLIIEPTGDYPLKAVPFGTSGYDYNHICIAGFIHQKTCYIFGAGELGASTTWQGYHLNNTAAAIRAACTQLAYYSTDRGFTIDGTTLTYPTGSITLNGYEYPINAGTLELELNLDTSIIYASITSNRAYLHSTGYQKTQLSNAEGVVGVYQGGYLRMITNVPEDFIHLVNTNHNYHAYNFGMLMCYQPCHITEMDETDSSNIHPSKIWFSAQTIIGFDGRQYNIADDRQFTLETTASDFAYGAAWICYDPHAEGTIRVKLLPYNSVLVDNNSVIIIGTAYRNHLYIIGSGAYTFGKNTTIGTTSTNITVNYASFVWDGEKLTIPRSGWITGNGYTIGTGNVQSIAPSETSEAYYVVVNVATSVYRLCPYNKLNATLNEIIIGFIYGNNLVMYNNYATVSNAKGDEVYCFGDSITAGTGDGLPFHYTLSRLDKHHICKNYGVGSTGYITTTTASVNVGNGDEGDGTYQATTGNNTVLEVMQSLGDITMSNILIAAGTNDSIADVDAFTTGVNNTLDYAKEKTNRILVITPILCENATRREGNVTKTNIIINSCKERGIQYFDGSSIIMLDSAVAGNKTAFMPDGLHPNQAGSNIYARAVLNTFQMVFDTVYA